LLREIQGITHQFEGTRYIFISLHDAWSSFYKFHQGPHQSLHEYLKDYQSLVQVLEHYGAAIGADGPYIESVKTKLKVMHGLSGDASDAETLHKMAVTATKQQTVAIAFMKGADKRRYGALWSDLENQYSRGIDQFPTDLTSAYNLLLNWKAAPDLRPPRREPQNPDDETSGLSFLQNGGAITGTDGADRGGDAGHISRKQLHVYPDGNGTRHHFA
jgi:hypothetical protein